MMLFDLSPTNAMSDSSVESSAPHQGNTNMSSLIREGDSNNSSQLPSDALPRTSKRKSSSMTSYRSMSIPLPSTHVARTQSEQQLCWDTEAAEQRNTNMFYRLVNGIRKRHFEPTRDVDVISSERNIAGIYHSRVASKQVRVSEQNHAIDPAQTSNWQMLNSTRGRVSESGESTNDEWSVNGFDSSQYEQPNAIASITLHGQEDAEYDEGVFNLDL
jgi:hypothetical protein